MTQRYAFYSERQHQITPALTFSVEKTENGAVIEAARANYITGNPTPPPGYTLIGEYGGPGQFNRVDYVPRARGIFATHPQLQRHLR